MQSEDSGKNATRVAPRPYLYTVMIAIVLGGGAMNLGLYYLVRGMALPYRDSRVTGDPYIVADPEIGFVARPRSSSTIESLKHGLRFFVHTDRWGARVADPGLETATPVDILAIGCSFTWGHGLDAAETYPEQLAQLSGLRVANLGQTSYGSVQSLLVLRRLGSALRPRLVIYAAIDDHPRRDLSPCAATGTSFCVPTPWFDGRGIVAPDLGLLPLEPHRAVSAGDGPISEAWLALRQDLARAQHAIRPPLSPARAAEDLRYTIGEMLTESRRVGARLIVLHYATPTSPIRDAPAELVAAVDGRDLVYVDAAPAFRAARGALAIPGDGHPNAAAHRIVAETLAPLVEPTIRRAGR